MNINNRFELPGKEVKEDNSEKFEASILKFEGVEGKDVYNSTRPFVLNGETYILGRVESRETETDSQVMFFKKVDNSEDVWMLEEGAYIFDKLQDPSFTVIDNKLLVSGVEIWDSAKWGSHACIVDGEFEIRYNECIGYHTVFYEVNSIDDIKPIAMGPENMKDVRLVELENGKLGIFTRPEEEKYKVDKDGKANKTITRTIAFNTIESIDELDYKKNKNVYNHAVKIEDLFDEGEWGGVNEAFSLKNGQIGVLWHKANMDSLDNKYYKIMISVFDFDQESSTLTKEERTEQSISVDSLNLKDDTKPKDSSLKNVIFPCGYDDHANVIYAGFQDSHTTIIDLGEKHLFESQGGIMKRVVKES